MPSMQWFTLRFREPSEERTYQQSVRRRTRIQGQTAIVVGMAVYLLCGLLDVWFAPTEVQGDVWAVRPAT